MTSKKRSARRKQRESFEAGLGAGLDDVYARAEAAQATEDDRRESAFRTKSCESKKRYDTRADAEEAIGLCAQHGRRGLSCYRCEYCGGWHLTSHPWK